MSRRIKPTLIARSVDGVLLKCLNQKEAKVLMGEIHEGVCGAHQSAHKMKWMIRKAGYFWPTMLEIVLNIIKDVKNAKDLVTFKNPQHWL